MIIDDDNEDLKAVRLGIEAEIFMASPLGKHLATRAQEEIDDATNHLIKANPSDIEANTRLRNRIYVAAESIKWIQQTALEGRTAHERIKEQEAQDY